MDLSGKKLLILGGNSRSCDIVNAAHELGVYTIVTDWYDTKRSPAKLISDEYWNEEIFNPDKLAVLAKEHSIDGVITGFTDSYLFQYQKLCELSNFPCYSTKEIFETVLDKKKFKKLCRDNGVPVVPDYEIEKFNPNAINSNNKIIIKPVDNSGSRGIIICTDPSKYNDALSYALSFSKKKQVVIEKFIELDSFSVSYTIQDGIISLSTMNDRLIHKTSGGGAVTAGGVYPSKYLDLYLEKMDTKVKNMYSNLGVKNGVLCIQGFTDGREFYFFEMGYRLSGGRHYILTECMNGISSVKYLIHFALTGKMADYPIISKDNARFHKRCFQINVLGQKGTIERIIGLDYVKSLPEVISASLLKKEGDEIGVDGTTAQQCIGIYLVAKDNNHFISLMNSIYQHFHMLDQHENDLTLNISNDLINIL